LVINRFVNGILISRTGTTGTPSINNHIRGNYIGTDVTGAVDLGNASRGVNLQTANNIVEGNLISGNDIHGISVTDNPGNNLIKNNALGTDVTGTLPLGNSTTGVALATTANNRIEGNVIAFNGAGVGMMASAQSNSILSNSFFGNLRLGIDLVFPAPPAGIGVVNLNDPLDGDGGPNNLQNFPVIDGERSFLNPALVQVWGSLDSKPSQDYLIQLFSSELADPSGHGEGQALIGELRVTTDASGHVDFHTSAMLGVPVGSILTATATDLLTNDTSEFGAWVNVDERGSPTAYENAAGAPGGDGFDDLSCELTY